MWSLKFYKAHNQGFIYHTCETQTYKASLTLIDQRERKAREKRRNYQSSQNGQKVLVVSQC